MDKQQAIKLFEGLIKDSEQAKKVWELGDTGYYTSEALISAYNLAISVLKVMDVEEPKQDKPFDEPQAEKVEVTEKQAELLRAFRDESLYELLANCLGEDEKMMAKAHLYGYTVKPKRWVVKLRDCGANDMRLSYFLHGTVDPVWALNGNPMVFTDKSKAEAVATLVEGTVEEV